MIYLHVVVLCFTAVKPHPSLAFGDWQTCVRALGSCSLQFFQWEAWPLGLTISLDSGMSRKFFSFSFFFREKLDLIIDCFPWLKYLKSVLFAGNSQQCLPQFSDRKILQRYQTLGHFLFLWFAPGLPVVYTQYWLKHDWMLTMQVKQEMFPQKDSQLWITVNSHSWSENQ